MCDGGSVLLALSALSAVGSAVGTVDGYIQQKASDENSRKLSRWQEQNARNQAKAAKQEASANAAVVRRASARQQAAMRARAAQKGGASGSMLDAMGQEAREYELQAREALYSGDMKAARLTAGADKERFSRNAASSPVLDPFDFVNPAKRLVSVADSGGSSPALLARGGIK